MGSAIENAAGTGVKLTTRRARPKWLVPVLVIACLGAIAAGVDARFVEPFRIEVTHFDLEVPLTAPLKIAQLSDVHTRGMGRNERRAFKILAQEKPDLIVVTGDCLANHEGDYRRCEAFYRQLHAPLGVWVVRGNWENDRPVYHERAFYAHCGVHVLVNAHAAPRPDFSLIGFDDYISGAARPSAALAGIPGGVYKIALFHSPAYLDQIAGRVNLCIAGHTHGGQVRVPFLPPLWLPKGCGRYVAGWYEEKGTRMYVNRGLGMSNLPIRFDCRPEITFLTLHP
jgi:predicted MPP superfamily phosphohydrolase